MSQKFPNYPIVRVVVNPVIEPSVIKENPYEPEFWKEYTKSNPSLITTSGW